MFDSAIKQYLLVTGNYWAFTLTDGALRMLVVLYFHQLGYSPLNIALLFLFYEFFGIVTNLYGGYLGAKIGLNRTMNIGLLLQVIALTMLLVPNQYLTVVWVMLAQALSGIAKDLNKMSAKSAIKALIPTDTGESRLYHWVAMLTGSKNALKGIGFFVGALLLTTIGFQSAILVMLLGLILVLIFSLCNLQQLGKAKHKIKFKQIFSKSPAINRLSLARLFLFAARDVWFVVALPVFLAQQLGWDHYQVGGFIASWIIGYGLIQTMAPTITALFSTQLPDGKTAWSWALVLSVVPLIIAYLLAHDMVMALSITVGLCCFGAFFAINSSIHSYLIVSYADSNGVSLDIGFYYMANAAGRLMGTVLSGLVYQYYGLIACLVISSSFIGIAGLISTTLPRHNEIKTSQE